jgi:hypothetical protein
MKSLTVGMGAYAVSVVRRSGPVCLAFVREQQPAREGEAGGLPLQLQGTDAGDRGAAAQADDERSAGGEGRCGCERNRPPSPQLHDDGVDREHALPERGAGAGQLAGEGERGRGDAQRLELGLALGADLEMALEAALRLRVERVEDIRRGVLVAHRK